MNSTSGSERLECLEAALARIRALFDTMGDASHSALSTAAPNETDDERFSTLYVTGVHLHQTLERRELLTRIRELLINVVGAARFGIFLRIPEHDTLTLMADETSTRPVGGERLRMAGLLAEVIRSGTPHYRSDVSADDDARPIACIPMRCGGAVLGVICLDALLPQKGLLGSRDREVLELAGEQAGHALLAVGAWRRLHGDLGDAGRARDEAIFALLEESHGARQTRVR